MHRTSCFLLALLLLLTSCANSGPADQGNNGDPIAPEVPDETDVPIEPPPVLSLSLESLTLEIGETATLRVSELSNPFSEAELTWSSSDDLVAVISNQTTPANAGAEIELTAYFPGEATVSVQLGDTTATCSVTVTDLTIIPVSLTLEQEMGIPLPLDAEEINCNDTGTLFTYSSIYVSDLEGNSTILAEADVPASEGSWSGDRYVFFTYPTTPESGGETELWLYDHTAQTNTKLASNLAIPMGSYPAFISNNSIGLALTEGLYSFDIETQEFALIWQWEEEPFEFSWSETKLICRSAAAGLQIIDAVQTPPGVLTVGQSGLDTSVTVWCDDSEVSFYRKDKGNSGFMVYRESVTLFPSKIFRGDHLKTLPAGSAVSARSGKYGILVFDIITKELFQLEGTVNAISYDWIQDWPAQEDYRLYIAVILRQDDTAVLKIYSYLP